MLPPGRDRLFLPADDPALLLPVAVDALLAVRAEGVRAVAAVFARGVSGYKWRTGERRTAIDNFVVTLLTDELAMSPPPFVLNKKELICGKTPPARRTEAWHRRKSLRLSYPVEW